MRSSRFLAPAVLALAVGVLAGCSDGRPSVSATPSAAPTPRATGPLADPDSPRRIVYGSGLVSDPLPASAARTARSSMSAADAIKVATEIGISPDQQPGTPAASLRLVYPGQPDGAQKVTGKPTWLLTWRDSVPAVRGGVDLTDEERRKLIASLQCVFVVTVDPASRTSTNSVQFCERT